jgi:PadR family transcriptional regulator, regulatory protein PadR
MVPRRLIDAHDRICHSLSMHSSSEHRQELVPGTLGMLILRTLARKGALHGYGIAQFIRQSSGAVLSVEEGSLYPALQRLLLKGLVEAKWRTSETGRRARFYALTAAGQKQLETEVAEFGRMTKAIQAVLGKA